MRLLMSAEEAIDRGQHEEALDKYTFITQNYGDLALAEYARIGRALCLFQVGLSILKGFECKMRFTNVHGERIERYDGYGDACWDRGGCLVGETLGNCVTQNCGGLALMKSSVLVFCITFTLHVRGRIGYRVALIYIYFR